MIMQILSHVCPFPVLHQGWFRRDVPMTLAEALVGIFCGNANGGFVPGPGLLSTNAQDVNGFSCLLYNIQQVDSFGWFDHILFGIECAANSIVNLVDPTFTSIRCLPNFPAETAPNKYGGAASILNSTSKPPGASKEAGGLGRTGPYEQVCDGVEEVCGDGRGAESVEVWELHRWHRECSSVSLRSSS
jgi:hypothetical protein